MGVSVELLKAVINYAASKKNPVIGPIQPFRRKKSFPTHLHGLGYINPFNALDLKSVDKTSRNRPMVRYYL
jgi:hypothetical protein